MPRRKKAKVHRSRVPSTEEGAAANQQQQQQQQQSLRHRLPGLRPPQAAQAYHPQTITPSPLPSGVTGGQGQGPAERWEQVPLSIQLMNEICDAMSIGSDFAFWSKPISAQ